MSTDPARAEAAIVAALADLLRKIDAFDGVYSGAFAMTDGRSAEDRRAVAVEPMDATITSGWDAGVSGAYADCRVKVTILARDQNGERCDSIAASLLSTAYNATIKAGLDGLVMPEFSRLGRWTWQPAKAPERRVVGTFQCRYLIDEAMDEDEFI